MSSSELPPDNWDLFEEIGQDPDPEPQHDCDCWRLTRALEPDEGLPDHICLETARATTRMWWRRQVGDFLDHIDIDCTMGADDTTDASQQAVPLYHVLDRESARWPTPYRGRHLGFVIEQWTKGNPSKALANQLAGDVRWQREVRVMRHLYDFLVATRSGDPLRAVSEFVARTIDEMPDASVPPTLSVAFNDEWLAKAGWSGSKAGRTGQDQRAIHELQARLRSLGLPFSYSVLRHLRAVAAGLQQSLPGAELLVTSLVYVGIEDDSIVWCRQNPEFSTAGSLTAGPLTEPRNVAPIARRHREFTQRYTMHPFADLRSIRRAQPGSAADPDAAVRTRQSADATAYTDYIEEARNHFDELRRIARNYGDDRIGAITGYLDRVQRRVYNRRRRRGLPTAPPEGWRRQLVPELDQSLRSDH